MKIPNNFRKAIAWALIVTMINPLVIAPAFAFDTDIFLSVTSSTTTAEPNVMIVLDSSDSMNYPEAWTEYPGAYDSHVEYLWNDVNIINAGAEQTTESQLMISTDKVPQKPTSAWGFWAGPTLADRQKLWNSALASANANESGDPGPRSIYRNYQDASWLYWLPAGTSTGDARLRSTTFSRFQGAANGVKGIRGNISFPPSTGPKTPYDYTTLTDASTFNACNNSLAQLTPSTIFAPSSYARNSGVLLNQNWFRYDPFLGLDAVNTSNYPGPSTKGGSGYVDGYIKESAAPTPGSGGFLPATWPDTSGPNGAGPFRDADTNNWSTFNNKANATTNASNSGTNNFPLPIRSFNPNTSWAGWTDIAPDLGGYIFGKMVTNTAIYPTTTVLMETLKTYGISNIASSISTYITTATSGLSATAVTDAQWQATAILGNRDTQSKFDLSTGLRAYYDDTQQTLSATTTCDPNNGVTPPGTNGTSKYCADIVTNTAPIPGVTASATYTATCSAPATLTEKDASGSTRTSSNGACTTLSTSCTDTIAGKPGGGAYCTQAVANGTLAAPACAFQNSSDTFNNIAYKNCAWSGRLNVPLTSTCVWQNRTAVTVSPVACAMVPRTTTVVPACAWSTRALVTVGACVASGRVQASVSACSFKGQTSITIGNCTWKNRQQAFVEGVGNLFYGGTCSDAAGATGNCASTGVSTFTIAGTSYNNVTGPFADPVTAAQASSGCGSSVAPGSYTYGGSCSDASNATTNCTVSNQNSVLINGVKVTNVTGGGAGLNASCGLANGLTAGTYVYGGTCNVAAGTAATAKNCAFSGGSTLTIAGVNQSNAAAGTLGADPVTCGNTVAAGQYATGGSCTATTGATGTTFCSATTLGSKSLNGTNYTNVVAGNSLTAGCTSAPAPGTYFSGGACTAGGVVGGATANCSFAVPGGTTVAGIGGTTTIGPNLADTATCTTLPTPTGTYMTGGTCTDPTTGSAANCVLATQGTVTLNGQSYNNVTGAFATNPPTALQQAQGCTGNTNSTVYYGGVCAGDQVSDGTTRGTALTTVSTASPANCAAGGSTMVVNGNTLTNAVLNSATQGCTALAPVNETCTARGGYGGVPCADTCSAPTNKKTISNYGALKSGTVDNFFQTYQFSKSQDRLVHDCRIDQPIANPGTGGSYMFDRSTFPASFGSGFGQDLSTAGSVFTTVSVGGSNTTTAAYTTNSANGVTSDPDKNIDVYSVNYLNWMYGPKGPTGAPIGRKTRLQIAKDALSDLVASVNGVRFGLMVFNKIASDLTNEGANVASAIRRMGNGPADLPDYNNRSTLINAINGVVAAARTPLTESIYEAYRYFSGRSPKWGTNPAKAFIGGTVSDGYDKLAISNGTYVSPMLNNPSTSSVAGCQKNFIILITDGGPEDDWSNNADVRNLSWAGTGTISPRTTQDSTQTDTATAQFEVSAGVPFGPTDDASKSFDGGYIWLDELTYFMANADMSPGVPHLPSDNTKDALAGRQSVNTYTIGFAGATSAVLQNAAIRGNGVYYTADNSSALSAAIIAALATITSWNPTVAAPTVPISALNRSENATEVYLAFFQPDPSSAWLGTVKKYHLSHDPADCGAGVGLCLVGQTILTKAPPNLSPAKNIETLTRDPLTSIDTSAVDDNASSFWAPPTVTDGSKANAGGTGYQLVNNLSTLTPDTRNVYTFLTDAVPLQDGNSGSTVDLTSSINQVHFSNAAKITACRLGDLSACPKSIGGNASPTLTAAQQETRINWIRGGDTASTPACTDGGSSTCDVWRNWPHADVQHSKPAIVTYDGSLMADPTDPKTPPAQIAKKQFLYYVQNNGLLTAIDTSTGIEQWAFMVEEALPKIQAMTLDKAGPEVQVADGSPAIYINDINQDGSINGSDQVILYFGMRRGGNVFYAIDVTSPTKPTFLWKIDANTPNQAKVCYANGKCKGDKAFNELGQTWSTPFIGKVRGNSNPVLIFGGGYDPAEDTLPPGTRTMGRAVYVIDALTAQVVQSWGVGQSGQFLPASGGAMIYSIPSDVTALNTDLDAVGYLDRLYVGDTGGNLWRMDIDDINPGKWTAKLLANLSSDRTAPAQELRKILFPPAAVKEDNPRFDAVFVGTGDREHPTCLTANSTVPLMKNTCANFVPADKLFMIRDNDVGLTATDKPPIVVSDLLERTTSDVSAASAAPNGWYRDLDNGEKVVNAPTVFANRVRFGTYAPLGQSASACVPLGEGRLNELDGLSGNIVLGGNNPQPSDRYYSSFITHGYVSTGQLIVEGKSIFHVVVSDSRLQALQVGTLGSATKVYWYLEPEQ